MMSVYNFLKSQVFRRWQKVESDGDVVVSSGSVPDTRPSSGEGLALQGTQHLKRFLPEITSNFIGRSGRWYVFWLQTAAPTDRWRGQWMAA